MTNHVPVCRYMSRYHTIDVGVNSPNKSPLLKTALHLPQVWLALLSSWFKACRWRCSALENDLVHVPQVQRNSLKGVGIGAWAEIGDAEVSAIESFDILPNFISGDGCIIKGMEPSRVGRCSYLIVIHSDAFVLLQYFRWVVVHAQLYARDLSHG
jgi:hypothetical protein